MVYLLYLIWGYSILSVYDDRYWKSSEWVSFLLLMPFMIVWVLIVGGQYYVGTDYPSYLDIFNGINLSHYENNGEYLFYNLVFSLRELGISGQALFFIFAVIFVHFYWLISRKIALNESALFFLLFMAVSTLFHTQMNGLRQCTSVYFVTLALIYLYEGKTKHFFILTVFATGFHISSLVIFPIYFLRNVTVKSSFIAKGFILLAAIVAFVSLDTLIREYVAFIPLYAGYADNEYLASTSVLNKLTKMYFLPFYLLSTNLIKEDSFLSEQERRFYQLGFWAYLIRIVCLVSTITNRLAYFFLFLSIIPIFYYLVYLKKNNPRGFLFSVCYILLAYLMKILFMPTGEYFYSSIYFL